mgnify:CR=1 FL=1
MIKYTKTGEKMVLGDVLREMNDMLTNDFEGQEVVNVYNDMMGDKIEYLVDDGYYEFRKASSIDNDGRH